MALGDAFTKGFNVAREATAPGPDVMAPLGAALGEMVIKKAGDEIFKEQRMAKLRSGLAEKGVIPFDQAKKLAKEFGKDETFLVPFSPSGFSSNDRFVDMNNFFKGLQMEQDINSHKATMEKALEEVRRSRAQFAGIEKGVPMIRDMPAPGESGAAGVARPATMGEMKDIPSGLLDKGLTPYQKTRLEIEEDKRKDKEALGGLTPLQKKNMDDAKSRVMTVLRDFKGTREQAESIILNPRAAGIPIPSSVQLNPDDFSDDLDRFQSSEGETPVGWADPRRLLPGWRKVGGPKPREGAKKEAVEETKTGIDKRTGKAVTIKKVGGEWRPIK